MKFYKKLRIKFYYFRHRNWSAPTIMGTFIVFCMMLVYIFESIGLLKSERTINYRIRSLDNNNEVGNFFSLNVGNNFEVDEKYKWNTNLKFQNVELENKIKTIDKIISIIYSGMNEQLLYEENKKKFKCSEKNNDLFICDNSTRMVNVKILLNNNNEHIHTSYEQNEENEYNYFDI